MKQAKASISAGKIKSAGNAVPDIFYYCIVCVFSFALYANSIFNNYNLDDELVTRNHRLTSQGVKAIPEILSSPYYTDEMGYQYEYRPVVHISFAIEHQFFGQNAHVSHFINVLLYTLICFLLLRLLNLLLGKEKILFNALVVLLFAAHPVHTEVVDSIKNRDELLGLLFAFAAFDPAVRYSKSGNLFSLVYCGLLLLLGLFSKQSIFVFVFIIPLSVILFVPSSFKRILLLTSAITVLMVGFATVYFLFLKVLIVLVNAALITVMFGLRNPEIFKERIEATANTLSQRSFSAAKGLRGLFRKSGNWILTVVAKLNKRLRGMFSSAGSTIGGLIVNRSEATVNSINSGTGLLKLRLTAFGTLILYVPVVVLFLLGAWNSYPLFSIIAASLAFIFLMLFATPYQGYGMALYLLIGTYAFYQISRFHDITPFVLIALLVSLEEKLVDKKKLYWWLLLLVCLFCIVINQFYNTLFVGNVFIVLLIYWVLTRFSLPRILILITVLLISVATLIIGHLALDKVSDVMTVFLWGGVAAYRSGTINAGRLRLFISAAMFLLLVVFSAEYFTRVNTFGKIEEAVQAIPGNTIIEKLNLKPAPKPRPQEQKPVSVTPGTDFIKLLSTPAPRLAQQVSKRPFSFVEIPVSSDTTFSVKAGTTLNIYLRYFQKLVIPYPLVFYYGYKSIEPTPISEAVNILSLLVHLLLFLAGFYFLRSRPVLSLAIFTYLGGIAIYSNYFIPTPGMMAERFMLVPSLGYCLGIAYLLVWLTGIDKKLDSWSLKQVNKVVLILIGLSLVTYSVLTISRNFEWKDKLTLMRHDIKYMQNSAQGNNLLGTNLVAQAQISTDAAEMRNLLVEATGAFRQALVVYPQFFNVAINLGRVYSALGQQDSAIEFFELANKIDPNNDFPDLYMNLGDLYSTQGNLNAAEKHYRKYIELNPGAYSGYDKLSRLYFTNSRFDLAVATNKEALEKMPGNYLPAANLGVIYLQLQQKDSAGFYFKEALKLNSSDPAFRSQIEALIKANSL